MTYHVHIRHLVVMQLSLLSITESYFSKYENTETGIVLRVFQVSRRLSLPSQRKPGTTRAGSNHERINRSRDSNDDDS